MCGIAGVIGDVSPLSAESAVRAMVAALAHRGPDSEGIEHWHGAVLGHRRLAIFDLSELGRQPMLSGDRSLAVVFNGAIYNYRELRKELIAAGYAFRSHTDTEVLLHGYRAWGLDRMVSKLRGMFAFALWDDAQKRLYLARDRLGVKPLVFAASANTIAFASTVRALRVAGCVGDLDDHAVADFLQYGFIRDDLSIYRGAIKVPAASIVEWSNGSWKLRRYWSLPRAGESPRLPFQAAVEETERLLLDSVETRLHADVPVGALLSGGIDSSLVCWAVAKLGGNVTAYTIGTPGDQWDETELARKTARVLGIEHRVLEMREQEDPAIDDIVCAYGEPFASASALGMLVVSRAVASSAKVLLTGEGGDDVFLGYPRHRHLWLAEKISRTTPSPVLSAWRTVRSLVPRRGALRRAASLLDYVSGDLRAFLGDATLSKYTADGLLGDRWSSVELRPSEEPWATDGEPPSLAALVDYEQRSRFVGEYMTKVDGATMYRGLEARSPFLDQFIWEFAGSLPFDIRLRGGRLKAILRELARRRIGTEVSRRRKRGFGVPVQRWIAGRWRQRAEESLQDSILDRDGWINASAVCSRLHQSSREGLAPVQLWYLIVLESWLQHERRTAQPNSRGSVLRSR